jgi:hypothetical protein
MSQRYTPDETTRYRPVTGTFGAVWRVTPWLSAIVNQGDNNAGPKFNVAILPGEKLPPPAEGRTPDDGVAGSLLDGKVYARATAFRTSQAKAAGDNFNLNLRGGAGDIATPSPVSCSTRSRALVRAEPRATSPRLPPYPAGTRRRPPHHRRRADRAHHR